MQAVKLRLLKNVKYNKCLRVQSVSTENGAEIELVDCNVGDAQQMIQLDGIEVSSSDIKIQNILNSDFNVVLVYAELRNATWIPDIWLRREVFEHKWVGHDERGSGESVGLFAAGESTVEDY